MRRLYRWAVGLDDPTVPRRMALLGWGILGVVVGCAQIYRSEPEKVLGVVFILGGAVVLAAFMSMRALWAVTGLALLALGFWARAWSGLFGASANLTGTIIIWFVWGGLGIMTWVLSRRIVYDDVLQGGGDR